MLHRAHVGVYRVAFTAYVTKRHIGAVIGHNVFIANDTAIQVAK